MNIKLDDQFFERLLSDAHQSPRKRSHYNLHKELDEPVQRLCIALKKGTYVRPHHHPKSNKWELMLALKGSVALLIFDENGNVLERLQLDPGNTVSGIELKPNTWHTVFPVSDEAVILEVKEGPFTPTEPTDFAEWAPSEGEDNVEEFLLWMKDAKIGDRFTA